MLSLNKTSALFVILYLFSSSIYAQHKLNFGLLKPQPAGQLPKSNAPVIMPPKKSNVNQPTVLIPAKDNEFILSNGWRMLDGTRVTSIGKNMFTSSYPVNDWYNAVVPGTVLTTLVERGVYPDPYFGINNLAIPDSLSRTDWWYRIPFHLPADKIKKNILLIFNGINYRADVWLNGQLLGKLTGAFRRGTFDATKLIQPSDENILAIHIFPPPNPGIPHEESARTGQGPNGGALCLDGPTFISSEGWDWIPGIRDRNIGLWQDVRVRLTSDIQIDNLHIVTDLPLPDTTSANITITTRLVNTSNKKTTVTLEGHIGNLIFSQPVTLQAKQESDVISTPKQFRQLTIKNPKLWWPNGYGSPNLHTLQLLVKDSHGNISDQKTITFGIREFSYDLSVALSSEEIKRVTFNPIDAVKKQGLIFNHTKRKEVLPEVFVPHLHDDADTTLLQPVKDQCGPYLVIRVNGKRIFCKGGNWGMDDGMKRVSRKRLEPYIKLHQQANFNMIRNWTAESTEEEFYQLCDEYGMLVWNDFWLSTEGFNVEPLDQVLTIENAKDVIARFRNHPSIALWCPRNEGYAPEGLEEAFALLIREEDGTRLYQGNSRYLNLRPSGPWHYFKNSSDYFINYAKGFTTEIGTFSVPLASTIRKFMAPEDQWPINDVWYYHDFHREHAQQNYIEAINEGYGTTNSLDDFCKKAQLVNYESHRSIFEAWNSRRWQDASGVLLWMSHPAWPSMIWQTYSSDYETHGAYFASRKACEPLHIQMNQDDQKIIIINSTLHNVRNTKYTYSIFELNGTPIFQQARTVKMVPANQKLEVYKPEEIKLPAVYLVRLKLTDKKGNVVSVNDYLKTTEGNYQVLNTLEEDHLSGRRIKDKTKTKLKLTNNGTSIAFAIKLKLVNRVNKEQVLPAYFSDGYFNLLPGESRELTVEVPSTGSFEIVVESYKGITTFSL